MLRCERDASLTRLARLVPHSQLESEVTQIRDHALQLAGSPAVAVSTPKWSAEPLLTLKDGLLDRGTQTTAVVVAVTRRNESPPSAFQPERHDANRDDGSGVFARSVDGGDDDRGNSPYDGDDGDGYSRRYAGRYDSGYEGANDAATDDELHHAIQVHKGGTGRGYGNGATLGGDAMYGEGGAVYGDSGGDDDGAAGVDDDAVSVASSALPVVTSYRAAFLSQSPRATGGGPASPWDSDAAASAAEEEEEKVAATPSVVSSAASVSSSRGSASLSLRARAAVPFHAVPPTPTLVLYASPPLPRSLSATRSPSSTAMSSSPSTKAAIKSRLLEMQELEKSFLA
jgi:hypothetical protein